ncbi:TrmB family transcriptional regulator [Aureisphaera sp.]
MEAIIRELQEIGLNKMEAEVYLLLLGNEPITAYKIGKMLNKPTANIYKAVDSLSEKGAIVIQNGSKRLCKAIDVQEFLNALQFKFNVNAKNVSKSLSKVKKPKSDDGTYVIKSVDLVFEKVKKMIDHCNSILILDTFPIPYREIETNIQNAIKRGVTVHLISYSNDVELKGANIVVSSIGPSIMEKWKSQQLNIVVDGKDSLISLFNNDLSELHHASWSTNPYLCYTLHSLLMNYNTTTRIINTKNTNNKLAEIEGIIKNQEDFIQSDASGFHLLMKNENHKIVD